MFEVLDWSKIDVEYLVEDVKAVILVVEEANKVKVHRIRREEPIMEQKVDLYLQTLRSLEQKIVNDGCKETGNQ